jgi:hypothetical protein
MFRDRLGTPNQSPDSGTSVWSANTFGDATGRSAYQS